MGGRGFLRGDGAWGEGWLEAWGECLRAWGLEWGGLEPEGMGRTFGRLLGHLDGHTDGLTEIPLCSIAL